MEIPGQTPIFLHSQPLPALRHIIIVAVGSLNFVAPSSCNIPLPIKPFADEAARLGIPTVANPIASGRIWHRNRKIGAEK